MIRERTPPRTSFKVPVQIPEQVSVDITYKDFCYLQDLIKNNPQAAKPIKKIMHDNYKIYRVNFGIYLFNASIASYLLLTNKYMNHDITVMEMIISNIVIPITAMYTLYLPSFMYKYLLHKNIYTQIKNL